MGRIIRRLDVPPAEPDLSAGYLDLLGPAAPAPPPTVAQRAMRSSLLPKIYERVWRPVGFGIAKGGPFGPSTEQEYALARNWLGLGRPGDPHRPDRVVLDVACGPGNVTRALAAGVAGRGLVVGIDAAPGMLARAVADTTDPQVGYVRGDATDLPFQDASFDAVCCYGALYLFDDPWRALDSMTRVLRPGGRIVILTSRRPDLAPVGTAVSIAGRLTGVEVFGHQEIVDALAARGYVELRRRRYPLMQYVGGRLD
ncbi:SAM-dependent methyltransferase [Actinomadura craniellae]|uniref:SAM-dependent methyltransferase n=2 Tax=Actinomadura craniellae TaxID=2231787 RepID=A0A365GYN4_9ACTN|nr:SAM-dependent methyltransferase [Actinomadura craniellae]